MDISKIKRLIAEDRIDETINSISNNLDSLEKKEKDDLILLTSRYESYRKKKIGGFDNDAELNRFKSDLLNFLGTIQESHSLDNSLFEKEIIEKIVKTDALATITKFKGLRRKVLDSKDFDEKKMADLVDKLEEIQEKAIDLAAISNGFFVTSETREKNSQFIISLFDTMRLESVQSSIDKLDYEISFLKFMNIFIPIAFILILIIAIIFETLT